MASNFETLKKSLLDKVSKINSYKPSSSNYTKPKSFYNSKGLDNANLKSTSQLPKNNVTNNATLQSVNVDKNYQNNNSTVNANVSANANANLQNTKNTKANVNSTSFDWLVSKNNETNKKVNDLLEDGNPNAKPATLNNSKLVENNKDTQIATTVKPKFINSALKQSNAGLSKQELLNKITNYKRTLASKAQADSTINAVDSAKEIKQNDVSINKAKITKEQAVAVEQKAEVVQNNTTVLVKQADSKGEAKPKEVINNLENNGVDNVVASGNVDNGNVENVALTEQFTDTSKTLTPKNNANTLQNKVFTQKDLLQTNLIEETNAVEDNNKPVDLQNNTVADNNLHSNTTVNHNNPKNDSAIKTNNSKTNTNLLNNDSPVSDSVNVNVQSNLNNNVNLQNKPLNNIQYNNNAQSVNTGKTQQDSFNLQNSIQQNSVQSDSHINSTGQATNNNFNKNTSNNNKHYSVSNNANTNYAYNDLQENNFKNTNNNASYSANNDVKLNYYNDTKQPLVEDFSLENIEIGDSAVSYENLQTLKREIAVLEEKLNGSTNTVPAEEVKLKSIDNGDEMNSKLDMLELKQTVNTLLEKLSALSSAPKQAESNSGSLEHAVLLNSLVSGQNKNNNNDSTKDFLAMQSYLNNLSTKLDFSMYANAHNNSNNNANHSNNNNGSSNNSGGTDSSSIIKDLINYKLIKSLSFDDERPSRDRSRELYVDMNDKMLDMGDSLLKNIKDNLGLAKKDDMLKISASLDKLALLHENSLTVKSGMVDMLNKLNENTSNIDGKLNRINNMVDSSSNNNEEVDDNLYSINNKLDYILNYLAKKNEEEKQEDHLVTVNTLQDKLAKLENLLLSAGNAEDDYDYDDAEVICSENDDDSRPDYLDSLKEVDVKQKNAKLKAVDVQANMEYLQNAINKAVNNSKK